MTFSQAKVDELKELLKAVRTKVREMKTTTKGSQTDPLPPPPPPPPPSPERSQREPTAMTIDDDDDDDELLRMVGDEETIGQHDLDLEGNSGIAEKMVLNEFLSKYAPAKPIIKFSDLQEERKYYVLGAYRANTKYGQRLVLRLRDKNLFMPKTYADISEATLIRLNAVDHFIARSPQGMVRISEVPKAESCFGCGGLVPDRYA